MLYPHPLPSAEASSFLAILHHFKKVLMFQLLLHETRNEKKKKIYNFYSHFCRSLFSFEWGREFEAFSEFLLLFLSFFYHLSLTLGFVCLECTIVCVATANTVPPLPLFFQSFPFFGTRTKTGIWFRFISHCAMRLWKKSHPQYFFLRGNISCEIWCLISCPGPSCIPPAPH